MNNYYYNIIDKILNSVSNNKKILFYIDNYFNPLDYFNHIIKKKSLHLYFIISEKKIYDKLLENIQEEDIENNIHLYNNINQLNSIKMDYIILFHLYSITLLEIILNEFNNIINNDNNDKNNKTNIYIYCSLSNEKIDIIIYKNIIRNNIKKYIGYNIGNLLSLHDIMSTIQKLEYKINNISIYKNNHYIIYGDNKVYQLIIEKN